MCVQLCSAYSHMCTHHLIQREKGNYSNWSTPNRAHLVECVQSEVEGGAGGGEREVLLGDSLHLRHYDVRLLHLLLDISCFLLEVL